MFHKTGELLSKEKFTVSEAWCSSLEELKKELYLQQEDMDILLQIW